MPEQIPDQESPSVRQQEMIGAFADDQLGVVDGEREASPASYHFVLSEHVPQNAGAIAEELADCDVIALEFVGFRDKDGQATMGDVATQLLSPGLDESVRKQTLEFFTGIGEGAGPLFIASLLDELAGSGKTVRFIDMTMAHPSYEKELEYQKADQSYDEAIESHVSNDHLRSSLLEEAHAMVPVIRDRDIILQEDCTELGGQFPGARIGAVIGREHDEVAHVMGHTADVDTVTVDSGVGVPLHIELYRELLLDPNSPTAQDTLDRIILADLFEVFGVLPAWGAIFRDDIDVRSTADGHVRAMSDERVSTIMGSIDAVKQRYRMSGRLKRQIYQVLADAA